MGIGSGYMKIYFAGYGHPIHKTSFIRTKLTKIWRFMFSYYYIELEPDKGIIKRFNWAVKERNKQSANKSKRTIRRS